MSNNSSANLWLNLEEVSPETVGVCFSAPVQIELDWSQYSILGPPIFVGVDILPIDILGPPVQAFSSIDFITGSFISFSNYIGDVLVMPNIIHIGDEGALNVNTIIIADKTGRGNATIISPSGAAFQISGLRLGYENISGVYNMPLHKSGFTWTNTGVTARLNLPSGVPVGTSASIVRTGQTFVISPLGSGRIWNSTAGFFRSPGSGIFLAASGSKISLMSDGSNGWIPSLEEGTISAL